MYLRQHRPDAWGDVGGGPTNAGYGSVGDLERSNGRGGRCSRPGRKLERGAPDAVGVDSVVAVDVLKGSRLPELAGSQRPVGDGVAEDPGSRVCQARADLHRVEQSCRVGDAHDFGATASFPSGCAHPASE